MRCIMPRKSFSKLVKSVGFPLAVSIRFDSGTLPDKFTGKQGVSSWKKVIEKFTVDSPVGQFALGKMCEEAKTFYEWESIYLVAYPDSDAFGRALKMMYQLAKTLPELATLNKYAPDERTRLALVSKMFAKTDTTEGWLEVLGKCPAKSDLAEAAFKSACQEASTVEDWHDIYICGYRGAKKIALAELEIIDGSFSEWDNLYNFGSSDVKFRELALKKLDEADAKFDDYYDAHRLSVSTNVVYRDVMMRGMFKKAIIFSHWHRMYNASSHRQEERILEEMHKTIVFSEWCEIHDIVRSDEERRIFALENMAKYAKGMHDRAVVYNHCRPYDKVRSKIYQELCELDAPGV